MKHFFLLVPLLFICIFSTMQAKALSPETPVGKNGQLRVEGTRIVNSAGETVQLAGMSFFWSQWIGKYYNANCVQWLASDWKCSIVRAAMGVGHGGYAKNPKKEMKKVEAVIEAAIKNGVYVLVDFHEHAAENYIDEAKTFFSEIARKYGSYPNIIYEIYNEPLQVSWLAVIKPYSETVIGVIREHDPDNIIVCGTPNWSQNVDEASSNPIDGHNLAYSLHFYAGTHKEWLMEKAEVAMQNGLCLFVTEYGTTDANGNGPVYGEETRKWYDFMDLHHISHCNWSVADKDESSAALVKNASKNGRWKESDIKPSGLLVKKELLRKYREMFPGE
ncbi:MAG TPA: glycoside hydrolase family 5 protein [Prolixibacteraceae bacterium]|nr:glycoside hydrolase family 5 protein [Prolixibacteraceae bacterium]